MSNRVRPTKSTPRTRPEPASPERRGLPVWLPIGIVAAVVVVVVIAFVASSGDDDPDTTAGSGDDAPADGSDLDLAFGPVELVGQPLPPQPNGGDDPAVGATMPGIRGFGPDGVERVFANGEPRAVAVMAHWCGHCQDELNDINAYLEGGGTFPDGVTIQTIATWSEEGRANFPPGEWLAENNWTHDTIVDDEDFTLASGLGLGGTPMWIFVDADGTVVDRAGLTPAAELAARMEALLA